MNEYVIRFSELNEEIETFEFLLEDSFFKVFQNSEWGSGRINAIVKVSKMIDGIILDFNLEGVLDVVCDRCLEVFPHRVAYNDRLFVKFGLESQELDDNIIVVARDDNQLELSQFLYEYLILSIPVKKVHPDNEDGSSGCNREMIDKLKKHLISTEQEETDPRWDDLKKLFDKN